jgi:hypothetical protein
MVIWRVDEAVDGPEFRAMFQGAHIAGAFSQRWEGRNMAAARRLHGLYHARYRRSAGRL